MEWDAVQYSTVDQNRKYQSVHAKDNHSFVKTLDQPYLYMYLFQFKM